MSAVLATVGVPPMIGDRAAVDEDVAGRVAADGDGVVQGVAEDPQRMLGRSEHRHDRRGNAFPQGFHGGGETSGPRALAGANGLGHGASQGFFPEVA